MSRAAAPCRRGVPNEGVLEKPSRGMHRMLDVLDEPTLPFLIIELKFLYDGDTMK